MFGLHVQPLALVMAEESGIDYAGFPLFNLDLAYILCHMRYE
jgi:hypothetical protein